MHTQQLTPQLPIPSSQTIPDQMRRSILVAFVHPRTRRAVSRPRQVLYGIGTLRLGEWGLEGEHVWDSDFGNIGVGRVGEVGSDEESGFFRGDSVPYYGGVSAMASHLHKSRGQRRRRGAREKDSLGQWSQSEASEALTPIRGHHEEAESLPARRMDLAISHLRPGRHIWRCEVTGPLLAELQSSSGVCSLHSKPSVGFPSRSPEDWAEMAEPDHRTQLTPSSVPASTCTLRHRTLVWAAIRLALDRSESRCLPRIWDARPSS